MKFIRIIAIISLIALSLSAKLRANENTNADWGSFDTTLRARFAFVNANTQVEGDSYPWGSWCRFNAKILSEGKAEGNYKYGIACEFNESEPDATGKKYLTNLSGNVWFLPYRNIIPGAQGNNWFSVSGVNRKLHWVFRPDSGEAKMLIIRLPYATFGNYITVDQLKNTFSNAENIIAAKNNVLINEKSKFVGNAEEMKSNSVFLKSAQRGESALKAQITEGETKKKQLQIALQEVLVKEKVDGAKAVQKYSEYLEIKKKVEQHKGVATILSNEINRITDNVKTAKDGITNVAGTLAKYQKIESDLSAKVDREAISLKRNTYLQSSHIDAAVLAARTYKGSAVRLNLNKFQPEYV